MVSVLRITLAIFSLMGHYRGMGEAKNITTGWILNPHSSQTPNTSTHLASLIEDSAYLSCKESRIIVGGKDPVAAR